MIKITYRISLVFMLLIILSQLPSAYAKRKNGNVLVKASLGDASYLNPVLATDSASGDVNSYVYNGLLKYDENLELTGDLAESFKISDDKLKIVFKLRKGVRWHDGEEFTSDDVRYTYEVIKDTNTRTPYSSKYDFVKSLTTPDKYTVVVEYSKVFSPALQSWGMGILPAHLYRDTDINTNEHNREPVGTGPYIFHSWKTDDRIVLVANKDYFEGPPKIERVIIKIIPDISVQMMALKKQILDWMSPTPDQWNKETTSKDFNKTFQRFRYPSFSYVYMGYNLKNPLFSDVNVRRAIAHAINKKAMIDAVLQGLGIPATGPYPPNSWAYDPEVKGYDYDPELALKILEKSGWKKDPKTGVLMKEGKAFSFTLMTNQGNNMRKLCSEIIQSDLAKIGIDVKLRIQEWSSFIHQYVDKRQFDAIVLGWSTSVDPDNYSTWHSSQMSEGQYNFVSYSNPEVDRLLEQGRSVYDMEKRKEIYFKIHKILHEDQPYLFLYFSDSMQIINKRVKNIKQTKAGIGLNFIDWYITEE